MKCEQKEKGKERKWEAIGNRWSEEMRKGKEEKRVDEKLAKERKRKQIVGNGGKQGRMRRNRERKGREKRRGEERR